MPYALHRGEILYWRAEDIIDPDAIWDEPLTRKKIEKRIKEIRKKLDKLLRQTNVDPELTEKSSVEDGEWRVYLTPSQRYWRGQEQQHCLGDGRGGVGEPYIAVSRGETDYGFWIEYDGSVRFDQAHGYRNTVPKELRMAEAAEVAQRWAAKATWSEDTDLDREIRYLRHKLVVYRRAEFALSRLSGRVEPAVEIADFHSRLMWRTEFNSFTFTAQQIREILLSCRDEGVQVTSRRVIEYRNRREVRNTIYQLIAEGDECPEVGLPDNYWQME